ncbi:MAG: prepilin-type N-terminal cleavage/methylation domain-containing protein [Holophagaceae bacterium]|nr:prepilin-type N-terminal cleavage/methylation domain-containing protein [Holophagaceae bacterium]
MTRRKTQKGFSLMELMIAMMIIAIIATLGFKSFKGYTARAHYLKSQDAVSKVRDGLDQYYLKHGKYPDFGSFEAMVDGGSPLVKENMIPVNVPNHDGFTQPFEGKSGKSGYELKCLGDPNNQEDFPEFTVRPGEMIGGNTGSGKGTTSEAPAAPDAKPQK